MIEDPAARKKHIVVEDEALIRLFICEALADAGFDVVETQHADEAVTLLHLRKRGAWIRLWRRKPTRRRRAHRFLTSG